MLYRESRNHLRRSGLIESTQMIGCLFSWGAYIREVLVRMEMVPIFMGAYIQGVPIIPFLRYIYMKRLDLFPLILDGFISPVIYTTCYRAVFPFQKIATDPCQLL